MTAEQLEAIGPVGSVAELKAALEPEEPEPEPEAEEPPAKATKAKKEA
jgi:hypothetical protein